MLVKLTDNLLVDLYEIVSIKKIYYDSSNSFSSASQGGELEIIFRCGSRECIELTSDKIEEEFNRIAGLFQQMHAPVNELGATE